MTDKTLADDLLIGMPAIARYTGIPARRLYWHHETGKLPTFKFGRLIAARKSELDRALSAAPRDGEAA